MKSDLVKQDYELIAEFEGLSIQEAKLEYSERQKLPASAFCGPNKTYPAQDAINVKKSLTKLSQFGNKLLHEGQTNITKHISNQDNNQEMVYF